MSAKNHNAPSHSSHSSEPKWLDLEEDMFEESRSQNNRKGDEERPVRKGASPARKPAERQPQPGRKHPAKKRKKKVRISLPMILLFLIVFVSAVIAFKLFLWDSRQRRGTDVENDNMLSFETEALDSIVPLDSSNVKKEKDKDLRILFLGNGSLAENKASDFNLANIVQAKTGATIYNCSIPGTFLSAKNPTYAGDYPYDALSFYYLCTLLTFGNADTLSWAENDLGGLPEEAKESIDLMRSIDVNELDVLCIYYDGADYMEQRSVIDLDNRSSITTFTGALNAGIELVKGLLPHTRIIVMSPTYAYAIDAAGNRSSSYERSVLPEPLNYYVGMQSVTCMEDNVSFVDNFYGSVYEEIAPEYLKDHIMLNEKGHQLLADRFLYALNKFHEYDF